MSRQYKARVKAQPQRKRSSRTVRPKLRSPGPEAGDLQRRLGNRGVSAWLSQEAPSDSVAMTAQRLSNRRASRPIQRKLTMGKVDDAYEREADEVATAVMRMPDPNLFRKPT